MSSLWTPSGEHFPKREEGEAGESGGSGAQGPPPGQSPPAPPDDSVGAPSAEAQAEFDAIQARKPAAIALIATYLKAHFGAADPAVLGAFEKVPREYFHYMYEGHVAAPAEAYEATPKPWAIHNFINPSGTGCDCARDK